VGDPRYGAAHQAERKRWEPVVAAGRAWCCETVCVNTAGRWIPPGTGWHLAHNTAGTAYLGPAHAACNEADGGRRSRQGLPRARPRAQARRWRPTRAW
jgi:hypothetical protein